MIKLVYIAVILFFINSNVFAQTAHANISATITTPVGMEVSNDITLNDYSAGSKIIQAANYTFNSNQSKSKALINIIGEAFSHNITVENYYASVNKKEENERSLSSYKNKSILSITVNFD